MHQLVYISTARPLPSQAQLDMILRTSRTNNDRASVTGLLVSGGGRFLQALEGPTSGVLATFERIKRDSRHIACVVLSSRSVDRRSFGNWAMAHQFGSSEGHSAIVDAVTAMTDNMPDQGLKAEFRTFAELHSKVA
jgi:hypothetical protein